MELTEQETFALKDGIRYALRNTRSSADAVDEFLRTNDVDIAQFDAFDDAFGKVNSSSKLREDVYWPLISTTMSEEGY